MQLIFVSQKTNIQKQVKLKKMNIVLSDTALKAITDSGLLYGEIAQELDVKPGYLKRLILDKDKRLTQVGVLNLIKKHKPEMQDSDLLREKPNSTIAA